ncbi:YHYH protein [Cerasicoccus frondis]|uniref:YHYH protein n=1 Tax=Cerasicoccus frondis TaxID=490090 RepID=UPI002852AA46|nr:YHYH protein [Cerasicoccus frondis]
MKTLTLTVALLTPVALLFAHGDHSHGPDVDLDSAISDAPSLGDVSIEQEGDYLIIQSKDLPGHETGQFPNRNNPNRMSAQSFSFQVPLAPKRAARPQPYDGYLFGVALNGVPFDPNTGEFWQNNRQWRKEAIIEGDADHLGVDSSNAHVQPSGMYHYHGIPWGLVKELQERDPKAGVEHPMLIGWAADGYPIYYLEGMKSSWRLKEGQREGGPGGTIDGTYTRDYEYVAESGDLDWLNGRYGPTAEYPEGTYQYHLTEAFPFVPRYFLGEPHQSFGKSQQNMSPHGGQRGNRPGGFSSGPGGQMRPPPPGRQY